MPSNLNSTGINLAFSTASIFALMALAEAIAALVSDAWFNYASSSANSINLWQTCSGTNCTDISFSDVNIGACTLSGKEIQGRFFSLRGLLLAGAVFSFFFALFILIGRLCDSLTTHVAGVVSSVIALFCFASVLGLFYNTAGSFLFCGMDVCDYFKTINPSQTKCYSMYGGAYGLVWCAGAASLISVIVGVCALYKMRSPERLPKIHGLVAPETRPGEIKTMEESELAALKDRANNHKDRSASPGSQQNSQMPKGLEDWRMNAQDFDFDEETGLYYSEEAQVYWDKSSNQFFDPSRRLWWDPIEARWKQDQ